MSQRVLVPVDGSTHSKDALTVAAEEFGDAELIVYHVVEPFDVASVSEPAVWDDDVLDRRTDEGEKLLEEYRTLAKDHGVDVRTELAFGKPTRAIVDAAGEFDVDHIVMGSRGRKGVARVLLGSVAENVVRRAPVTVTVVRTGE